MGLCTQASVEALLGRDLTTAEEGRAPALIAAASARFSAEAGTSFDSGDADQVLRVQDGRVLLPLRPVVAISSVHALNTDGSTGAAIAAWTWDGLWTLYVGDWWTVQINGPDFDADDSPTSTVRVAWEYGFDSVPDDVTYAVAGMVARVLGSSAAGSGVTSETIGGYSYRLGAAAEGGILGMTEDERMVARRYRRPSVRSIGLVP